MRTFLTVEDVRMRLEKGMSPTDLGPDEVLTSAAADLVQKLRAAVPDAVGGNKSLAKNAATSDGRAGGGETAMAFSDKPRGCQGSKEYVIGASNGPAEKGAVAVGEFDSRKLQAVLSEIKELIQYAQRP